MKIPLLCHWNGDGDIANAFLEYYSEWVSEFHLILHGAAETNRTILELSRNFPVTIHSEYEGPFDDVEKRLRLNKLAQMFLGEWLLLVDSDEFVELPYSTIDETVSRLEEYSCTYLAAPLLQRFRADCSLNSPNVVVDIANEFPMCSERLYELMGSSGSLVKFPLFKCSAASTIFYGNHAPPNELSSSVGDQISGVTHHFKWRRSVLSRIIARIDERWPFAATEAVPYLRYLETNDLKLPATGSFRYSRLGLFERNLLRRVPNPD